MVEFSVIIPVYNVEKYLRTCVDSILGQTFKDIEVILVDDGSTDSSGGLCDEYAANDKRVRVIHKENGGQSVARNLGMSVAVGKYIIFADSDDFFDGDTAFEKFHENLSESDADMLIFPAKRYYENDGSETQILSVDLDRKQITDPDLNKAIYYMLKYNIFRAAPWGKVTKKDVIDRNRMRFKEGYLSEDMDWCGDLLMNCRSFDSYEVPVYAYRQQRSGSTTVSKNEKVLTDKLYFCKKGYEQAMAIEDRTRRELLASYYAYEYSVGIGISSGVKDKKLLKQMKDLQVLLKYDICDKVKQVNKLKKFIGYGLTRKALCLFVKIKR